MLVAGVAVVGNFVGDFDACGYELRKDLETEMVGRWDPSGPAIIYKSRPSTAVLDVGWHGKILSAVTSNDADGKYFCPFWCN